MEETDYSNLSKAQRKKLKKEQRMNERELESTNRERKERTKKIRNYGIALLIILLITAFFYWRSIPPKNAPIIEITPRSYNFGSVSQARGVTSALMTIYNNGDEPLILNNMDTSCGCTSASVIYEGVEGPKFGMSMHGTNPTDWTQVIPPGDSAQLKVYYDPNVHKSMRGAVTRSVFIYSNDPKNDKEEVRINVLQVD